MCIANIGNVIVMQLSVALVLLILLLILLLLYCIVIPAVIPYYIHYLTLTVLFQDVNRQYTFCLRPVNVEPDLFDSALHQSKRIQVSGFFHDYECNYIRPHAQTCPFKFSLST